MRKTMERRFWMRAPAAGGLRTRLKVIQRDVPGLDVAYLAVDNETGQEVVWNEVQFSERKNFKAQEVSLGLGCLPEITKQVVDTLWSQVLSPTLMVLACAAFSPPIPSDPDPTWATRGQGDLTDFQSEPKAVLGIYEYGQPAENNEKCRGSPYGGFKRKFGKQPS